METKELQKIAVEIVDTLDKKFNIDRDLQLNFTQLIEEIGELAKDVNSKRLRNKDHDKENMEGEFADVLIQLAKLAHTLDIDLESAVQNKIEILKKRHGL
jgi:NTP pyrophosphatase (non-canonical NTP hydrolase)